ncbi:hypothetical protein GCM10010435_44240 [Winogradskya consettensis]|uniref:Uncharacterized protein n=1 Tax=Winogradskya consettensis TaxID=113560 RepID=A0A919T2N2_9ACTN|nr:hypothetical protein [Actinoplanes consettensis]GIM82660.1 hypothetical protein Aco04nite_82630 [Actinoplanes consettensis]
MSDMHISLDGLDAMAHDLDQAGDRVADELYPVAKKAAQNIKTGWRKRAKRSAGKHGKLYYLAIDYDIARLGDRIDAEIGPQSAKPQGGMGRGFEYGSVHTAPKPDGQAAVEAEAPKFFAQVEAAIIRALDT